MRMFGVNVHLVRNPDVIDEQESFEMAGRLASKDGILAGTSTGLNVRRWR
jgi:cysteine synthase